MSALRRERKAAQAKLEREAAENREKAAAEEAAQRAEEERRSALSPEALRIEDVASKLRRIKGRVNPGSQEFMAVMSLLKEAQEWPADMQQLCVREMAPLIKQKDMYQGKAAKEIKAILRRLRNE